MASRGSNSPFFISQSLQRLHSKFSVKIVVTTGYIFSLSGRFSAVSFPSYLFVFSEAILLAALAFKVHGGNRTIAFSSRWSRNLLVHPPGDVDSLAEIVEKFGEGRPWFNGMDGISPV